MTDDKHSFMVVSQQMKKSRGSSTNILCIYPYRAISHRVAAGQMPEILQVFNLNAVFAHLETMTMAMEMTFLCETMKMCMSF